MRTKLSIGRSSVLTLLTGAFFGFSFAYILFYTSDYYSKWILPTEPVDSYLRMIPLSKEEGPAENINVHHHEHMNQLEDQVAKVRILCWVLTQPKSHEKKAKHVKNTWGRRCNHLLFMSSEADYSLPAIRLKVSEGRDSLWAKTKEAFKYVHQHYMDRVDWVMKADDDTYVIVENLRYVLSQYNASDRHYMGCLFKPYVKQGYMSGGAGYVLSREAVRAFVEEALPKPSCRQDGGGAEDVEIGKCLEQVGVTTIDSRDSFGRHRFFPLPPVYHLVPNALPKSNWFWKYIYYPMKQGFECCSDTSISFHYISPNEMYVLEYLIYHVKPYGVNHNTLTTTPRDYNFMKFSSVTQMGSGKSVVTEGQEVATYKESKATSRINNDISENTVR